MMQVGIETDDARPSYRDGRAHRRGGCGSQTGKTPTSAVWVLVLAAALMASCGVGAASAAEPAGHGLAGRDSLLSARLQSLLDDLVEREPGVRSGLLLVDGPTLHWKGASGVAFAESLTPAVPDDQFSIDSIAKMMTATIAMKLVEQGTLNLDDRVAECLPESLVDGLHVLEGQSFSHEITVRQLLNHTSGIVDDWACPGFLDLVAGDPERRWSPEETIEYVKENCPPRFRPGDGWHYSDTGYNLLGLVLERVAEKPLHELYREMVLDPLGMEHTYRPAYEPPRPATPGRPPAERYLGDIECGLWTSVMTADWAGGGLVSTTEDLNAFLRAFVSGEVFADSLTKGEMLAWVESGPRNNYGLGVSRVLFDRFDDPSVRALGEVWGHTGSSHNFMYYWPQEDVTIIGTLNQMAVASDLYDTVASVLMTIHLAGQSGDGIGWKPVGKGR
ncbi:MAG: serine hydrolase domain-containing protein [bacterium]